MKHGETVLFDRTNPFCLIQDIKERLKKYIVNLTKGLKPSKEFTYTSNETEKEFMIFNTLLVTQYSVEKEINKIQLNPPNSGNKKSNQMVQCD